MKIYHPLQVFGLVLCPLVFGFMLRDIIADLETVGHSRFSSYGVLANSVFMTGLFIWMLYRKNPLQEKRGAM